MRKVAEVLEGGTIPLWRHAEWRERFPWLEMGITGSDRSGEVLDFGMFGAAPVGEATRRWRELRAATAMRTTVHSRQVHGAAVAEWVEPLPAGWVLVDGWDAHLTGTAGLLLTVSVADCVPVFLLAEEVPAIALVHAGWRGVAAGVVEAALARLRNRPGTTFSSVWMHCGPSICGECYEVGPEVHEAIAPGRPPPASATPIDLAREIAARAGAAGLAAERMTASAHCTRCGPGTFFSHRSGSAHRQLGVMGIRT